MASKSKGKGEHQSVSYMIHLTLERLGVTPSVVFLKMYLLERG